MKITSIGVQKGGVGKTTLAFNLACVLAESEKVLAIDIDPQCNLSNNFGIDVSQKEAYSSRDIFEETETNPDYLVVKQPISALPNLDVIPSNIHMFETDLTVINKAGRERILLNYIEDNEAFFKQYDQIIIDTNPSMSVLNQNGFLASDSIIMVAEADDNSLIGIELFMHLWGEIAKKLRKKNNIRGLIINKGDLRASLTQEMWDYCMNDDDLHPILVPQLIRVKEVYKKANKAKLPVTLYGTAKDKASATEAALEIRTAVSILKERGVF